jgi:sigma-E factor negative regulatory protein RseC
MDRNQRVATPVTHNGEVVKTNQSIVTVRLTNGTECEGCAAAKLCHVSGSDSGLIDVHTADAATFTTGDRVVLEGAERLHRKAIRLATLYPTIAIIATMVLVYLLTANETLAALSGLSVMILFFIILYLCRNRLDKEFIFTIRKL